MTNAVTIAQSGSTGSITGYRNRLINGSFDVWQRGTSFNNLNNVYTADRWKIGYQDDGAIYTQQVSDLPGFSLYMRMIKGGTANGSHMIQQAIETQNTVDMIGQWVTFSCWARLSNATTQATHQLNMALGFSVTTDYSGWLNSADICSYYATWRATGANGVTFQAGSTSSNPSTPVQSAGTLTTNWQRYYYTLLVPTNTKTIVCGVYSESTLQNGGIDVDGIQFELGTSPSTFDRRHIQQELAMCQRYFQWNIRGNVIGRDTGTMVYNHICPVPMRATPTVSLSTTSPYYENASWSSVGSLTGASVSNGHMTPIGGDILISGNFAGTSLSAGSANGNFGGNQILISAEI